MGNRRLKRECLFVKTWEIHFNLSSSQIFLFSFLSGERKLTFWDSMVGGTIEKFLPLCTAWIFGLFGSGL